MFLGGFPDVVCPLGQGWRGAAANELAVEGVGAVLFAGGEDVEFVVLDGRFLFVGLCVWRDVLGGPGSFAFGRQADVVVLALESAERPLELTSLAQGRCVNLGDALWRVVVLGSEEGT